MDSFKHPGYTNADFTMKPHALPSHHASYAAWQAPALAPLTETMVPGTARYAIDHGSMRGLERLQRPSGSVRQGFIDGAVAGYAVAAGIRLVGNILRRR